LKSFISHTLNLKTFLLTYVGWWTFWALVQTVVLHRLGLSWQTSLLDASVSNTLLGTLSLAAILLYRFYQPGSTNRLYRLIYAIGITIIYTVMLRTVLLQMFGNEIGYDYFLEQSMPLRGIFAFMFLVFVTIMNWMWNSLQDQKEREKRSNEAEQLVKEAELVKLRQQLQPHFLFNSLNSISALAGSKPEEARKMIQQLSDFLRGTLKKDENQKVSLKEELEHLALYLEIEKVRFGHRLNVEIDAPEEVKKAFVPPLLLQPVVENAIKFGLYGTIDEITVNINARDDKNYLYVTVTNPFDEQTSQTKQGTGFGLSSIQRRLFLLYSRNDLLVTEKKEGTFVTLLKIPQ
jgi:two-component system, LytTR family, sensor kinase